MGNSGTSGFPNTRAREHTEEGDKKRKVNIK